jgi:hypothetical protein
MECKNYGRFCQSYSITLTNVDFQRWEEEGRDDILSHSERAQGGGHGFWYNRDFKE